MSEFEKESVDFFVQSLKMKGFDDSTSMLAAVLYLEPGEVSMEELAKETGYSLATVCNGINSLCRSGFVKKTRKPGSKKIFLSVEKDMLLNLKEIIVSGPLKMIEHVKDKLPAILEKYENKVKSEEDKKRFKIIDDYYKQILKMEFIVHDVMKHLEELQSK